MDKNMKILIVDDFSTMRRIIKNLLRDLGFTNTDEADDGNTALPMLKSAAQAGVNGYVVKPFTAAVLKEKIEKIFERIQ